MQTCRRSWTGLDGPRSIRDPFKNVVHPVIRRSNVVVYSASSGTTTPLDSSRTTPFRRARKQAFERVTPSGGIVSFAHGRTPPPRFMKNMTPASLGLDPSGINDLSLVLVVAPNYLRLERPAQALTRLNSHPHQPTPAATAAAAPDSEDMVVGLDYMLTLAATATHKDMLTVGQAMYRLIKRLIPKDIRSDMRRGSLSVYRPDYTARVTFRAGVPLMVFDALAFASCMEALKQLMRKQRQQQQQQQEMQTESNGTEVSSTGNGGGSVAAAEGMVAQPYPQMAGSRTGGAAA